MHFTLDGRVTMRLLMASFVLATSAFAAAEGSEFEKYAGEGPLVGVAAKPRLATPEARRFRTVLSEAAARGPNFNGHYRIVYWGCGTNCIGWAVVDLQTGDAWMAPKAAGSCSGSEPRDVKVPDWFEMRMDSSLLYLHECSWQRPGRTFDIRHVYVWSRNQMKLLRTEELSY